jgi:DNA-binding MurR/RpiR family transcriptional regulator
MKDQSNKRELGCFIRIKNELEYISNSERKVAEYVLDNPERVVLASGAEIAERTGAGVATVTRLCKRLGYSGFQEFKIVLSHDIAKPLSSIHEDVKIDDDIDTIKKKITQANIHTLESTVHVLDSGELQKAVDSLLRAETIAFFGMGGSGFVALDALHKFFRTGKRCIAFVDKHMQLIHVSMFTKKDVMVGITHSGYNKDMLDVFNAAKEKGAVTIAITHNAASPVTKIADIRLYTSSKETSYRNESLSSRTAVLTIIDILYVALGLKIHGKMQKNIDGIRNSIAITRI